LLALDRTSAEAGRLDAEAARIPGFPYLRIDRFSATLQPPPASAVFPAWVAHLQALDREGREIELANLAGQPAPRLPASPLGSGDLLEEVTRCGDLLRQRDLAHPVRRELLAKSAKVPSSYRFAERVFGLYPLTSRFVAAGVERWQAGARRTFETPLERLPRPGALVRWYPPEAPRLQAPEVAALLQRASQGPLGIPTPEDRDRETLFATFAPVWELDVAGDDDRFGSPYWGHLPAPLVDIRQPTVFRHLSHTLFQGQILLQLNYVIWFPARAPSAWPDLLGGRLDGITWRVTLGSDGQVLLYDTIHNCGCYHTFFPTSRLRRAARPDRGTEPPLVFWAAPAAPQEIVLRVASGSHDLLRVYRGAPDPDAAVSSYGWRSSRELRSLPLPGKGRRSLFGSDGLIPGTERAERWLLWPMGVASPGAMRQWGHHATAFLGCRHFDDPRLLDRYFEAVPPAGKETGDDARPIKPDPQRQGDPHAYPHPGRVH
jgi:hypothetical protein